MAKPIGTLGNVPTTTVGGVSVPFNIPANATMFSLYAGINNGVDFSAMIKANGTSAYQVTAGKTLYIYALKAIYSASNSSASQNAITIGYSSSSLAGFGQASAPSSPTYMFNQAPGDYGLIPIVTSPDYTFESPLDFTVPANDYPFMGSSGNQVNMTVMFLCYEV